ncbi:MAG: hypothetical protein FJ304_12890 [Planctomycetes bacterium]|nr:hypothetical protein [Planctomycetota bacterium]
MAERVFCVDFGTAYTKVALRRDPTADSTLLACAGADLDFWVPTVVTVDRCGAEPVVEFGHVAADRIAGGGIDRYTNFKRDLFANPAPVAGAPAAPPLDSLLSSDEFVTLAARYHVPPYQVTALRSLVGSARALIAAPGERAVSLEATKQANAAKLTSHYFAWLRKQVLAACEKLGKTGLRFEDFPVRVSVPALLPSDVAEQPGCKLLREALHRAGWPLHSDRPFVAEPESNAVGVLTGATNALNVDRNKMLLGQMFGRGPLNTVVKGDKNHQTYRALVIDVGAFTTDLTSLWLDTGGNAFLFGTDGGFVVKQRSVARGVNNLDAEVLGALSQAKREYLEKLPRREFANFQRAAYTDLNGIRPATTGLGVIGGEGDRTVIDPCILAFGARVAEEVKTFCAEVKPGNMQELILTGGGCGIPAVRNALIAAAQAHGGEFIRVHAPVARREKAGGPQIDGELKEHFARGGSALGGASIYFESQYH